MTLPDAVTELMPSDNNLRIATVTARFPTTINVEGTDVPAGAISSYLPIVGDTVAAFQQDGTWLIFARTTAPATGAYPQMQAGSTDISVAAAASALATVTFVTPFRSIPSVCVNIASAPGPSAGWGSRAINVTASGFQIFIFSVPAGTAATFSTPVHWQAQERTQ